MVCILHLSYTLCVTEAGYLCIPAVLLALKALMSSSSPVDRKPAGDERDAATKCLVAVANIFQKVIELLARRLKKKPEESKEVRRHLFSQFIILHRTVSSLSMLLLWLVLSCVSRL